jgi:pimeloyl-ACP methyl ester carboxylesterase
VSEVPRRPLKVPSADGVALAVHPAGHGPGLVVVGGPLCDHTALVPLLPILTPRFTVYAYDRRGRGASEDAPEYSVARELEDLAAVVDYAGPEAAVYGHSSGAMLALEAAAAGLEMAWLVVYEPPYIVDGHRPRPSPGLADRLAAMVAAGERELAVRTFLREGSAVPESQIEALSRTSRWPDLLANAATLPYDARVGGQGVLPAERFSAVVTPTVVLCGGASPAWVRAGAEALAAALPDARLRILDGQNQLPDPELLARAILAA